MRDVDESKDQLLSEVQALRERNAELEGLDVARTEAAERLERSLDRLRQVAEGIVHVMAVTIEMRDPHTAGHQQRVKQLACAIAEELGLDREQVDGLRMAALVHDIGKIHVPAEILTKPSRLSPIEFGLIKAHPQIGYDILGSIELPWPIAEIILQHHERMDGSGYPSGLSGDGILLEARILAVADVVEAMSSHRAHRPTVGTARALEYVGRHAGSRYDTRVVEACQRLFRERGFEFEETPGIALQQAAE
jgi:putative nucleotidyltransferase with HDIG domain